LPSGRGVRPTYIALGPSYLASIDAGLTPPTGDAGLKSPRVVLEPRLGV